MAQVSVIFGLFRVKGKMFTLIKMFTHTLSESITAGNQTEISKYFIGHDKRSTKGSERGVSQHIKNKSSLHKDISVYLSCLSLLLFGINTVGLTSRTGALLSNSKSEAKTHGL